MLARAGFEQRRRRVRSSTPLVIALVVGGFVTCSQDSMNIQGGRYTARIDGDFVLFLIGMLPSRQAFSKHLRLLRSARLSATKQRGLGQDLM